MNTIDGIDGLWAAMEAQFQHGESDAKTSRDPVWAVVTLLLGSLLLVGAGAFLITVGLGR